MLSLLLSETGLLVMAALIPAIICMVFVYKSDKADKEPASIIFKCILMGVLSGLLVIIPEIFFQGIGKALFYKNSPELAIFNAFVVAALCEETAKRFLLKLATWKNKAFNYRFDAVVYSAFVSLGFAAFENILYVIQNGFGTAILRAIVSIPGHLAFSIIMGVFYGRAKYAEVTGHKFKKRLLLFLSVLIPILVHGFYDACLMLGTTESVIVFLIFMVGVYIYIFKTLKKESKNDVPLFSIEQNPEPVTTSVYENVIKTDFE